MKLDPFSRTFHSGYTMGSESWIIRRSPSGDYILPGASAKDDHQAVNLLRVDDAGKVLHAANPTPKTEPEKFACMFFVIVPRERWERRPK
ncbi:MAG: hypothetical protein WC600_18585 [Desulfobaccales bacterium]